MESTRRILDNTANTSGVCYNCLNGAHSICDDDKCTCRVKEHKSWWWKEEIKPSTLRERILEIITNDSNSYSEAAKAIEVIALDFAVNIIESIECGGDGYKYKSQLLDRIEKLKSPQP